MTEKNKSENELVREAVINEVSSDLAETQSEKFAELTKDVDFTDKESFTEKLNTLKENYFPKSTPQNLTEEGGSEEKEIEASGVMAAYTSAIKRQSSYAPFSNVKK